MRNEILEEIKERLSKISPVPWWFRKQQTASESADIFIQGCNAFLASGNWHGKDYSLEHAEFITHAPADIRALLDLVESYQEYKDADLQEIANLINAMCSEGSINHDDPITQIAWSMMKRCEQQRKEIAELEAKASRYDAQEIASGRVDFDAHLEGKPNRERDIFIKVNYRGKGKPIFQNTRTEQED